MTNYRFSEGAAIVFGGSGGLGTGIVDLLSKSGTDVAFTYFKNEEAAETNLKTIEENGKNGYFESVDLLNVSTVESFSNSAKEKFSRADAAGQVDHTAPASSADCLGEPVMEHGLQHFA